jgi:hypothetical protein
MTTGEGIFWGAVVVGLIGLYVATKDRWKWKRIVKWIGIALLIPIAGVAGWLGWTQWEESRPRLETSMYGISVGEPIDDVIYKKGRPDKETKNCPNETPECTDTVIWEYKPNNDVFYVVSFKEAKVRWIAAHVINGSRYNLPTFRGMSNYWGQADVEKLYGTPTKVSVSGDKSMRLVSFVDYGVFFTFVRDELISVGVMEHHGKPLSFASEATGN